MQAVQPYEGLKSFLMSPDVSMIAESFLEAAFLQGFESYFVYDDPYTSMTKKADILLRQFNELLIFFTIDKGLSLKDWAQAIAALQNRHQSARIGVLYKGIHSPQVDEKIKRLFLYELGISGGCIPLHFSPQRNQNLLLNVLSANEATGRRKHIRLMCNEKHQLNLIHNNTKFEGHLFDVSISHFSCIFDQHDPNLEPSVRLSDIQLRLAGVLFMVDAVVVLKRFLNKKPLYIFTYRNKLHKEGLDDNMKAKMNGFICKTYQDEMSQRFESSFHPGGR